MAPLPCPHPGFPPAFFLTFVSSPLLQYSPKVQVFEFLKAADLRGQLLNLVIKKVKHFQVLQFCYVWWHSYENKRQNENAGNSLLARNASNTFHFSFKGKRNGTPT